MKAPAKPAKEYAGFKGRERDFRDAVRQYATLMGWREYTTMFSKFSPPGFPDLCMVHAGDRRLVFAELKIPGGVVSKHQQAWLDDLGQVDGIEVYLWLPGNWPEITDVLKRRNR